VPRSSFAMGHGQNLEYESVRGWGRWFFFATKAAETESLDAKTTYEVIRREGVKELDRTSTA
jgi:hypothetical protein